MARILVLLLLVAAPASAFEVERPLPDCFAGDPTCGLDAGAGWAGFGDSTCDARLTLAADQMAFVSALNARDGHSCTVDPLKTTGRAS